MALRDFTGVGSGRIQDAVSSPRVGESGFFEAPFLRSERKPKLCSLIAFSSSIAGVVTTEVSVK